MAGIEGDLGTSVGLEKTNEGHYLVRVGKQFEKKVAQGTSGGKGYKVMSVRANNLMITTPEIRTASVSISSLEQEYAELQRETSQRVLISLSQHYAAVEELGEFLSELDALVSVANFSLSSLGAVKTRPRFNEGDRIVLEDSRHPLLDRTNPSNTIPNTCVMERETSRFHIITGPNMGGKSTYIRQVAVNIILAQIGSFVCAARAELPLFDNVATRVGAGDVQAKGLSTWMGELLEVGGLLEGATRRTFAVVDELGRGTSTSEGVGMTYAIAEHMVDEVGCYCLFATHYFELTALSRERRAVKNFSVEGEVREGRVRMGYKVKEGATEKSYGVQVLEMLGFPRSIVDNAERMSEEQAGGRGGVEKRGGLDEEEAEGEGMDLKVEVVKMYNRRVKGKRVCREEDVKYLRKLMKGNI